ncbi:MAG: nitroreductase family protein, partial [Christensenellaceae bacterium]|nr:nitroreductase family protein [Christensenellaceae bacterium]
MENNIVLKQIYERKSHRAFLDAAIAKEDKEKILMAAAMAPTAGNQQLYTIL